MPTLVDSAGNRVTVDPSQLAAATAPGSGYRLETPEETAAAVWSAENRGSVAEGLKHIAERGAQGATLGASSALMSWLEGPEYGLAEQRRAKEFAGLGMAAEIAGSLVKASPAGALASGAAKLGAGVAARMASRPVLGRMIGGATAAAIEGSGIGAGQAISESALQNKELSAELLWSHIGTGALVGGGIGIGLGSLAELMGAGKKALRFVPGIGNVVERGPEGAANVSALKSLGLTQGDLNTISRRFGKGAVDEFGREARKILEIDTEGAAKRALGYTLEEGAGKVASRAEELNTRLRTLVKEAEDSGEMLPAGTFRKRVDEEVLKPLRDSGWGEEATIRQIEKHLKPTLQQEAKATRIAELGQTVSQIEGSVRELYELSRRGFRDEFKSQVAIFDRNVSSKFGSQTIGSMFREAGMSDSAVHLKALVRDLKRAGSASDLFGAMDDAVKSYRTLDASIAKHVYNSRPGISPMRLWELKSKAGKEANFAKASADPRESAYRQIWKIADEELGKLTTGGEEFRAVNQELRSAIHLRDVSQLRSEAGNTTGALDAVLGTLGAVGGGSLGGGVGAVAGALATNLATRFARSVTADQLAAVGASRLAARKAASEAADTTATRLGGYLDKVTKGAVVQKVSGAGTRLADRFRGESNLVDQRQNENQRLMDEVLSRTSVASQIDPGLTAAVAATAGRGEAILVRDMPQPITIGDSRDSVPTIPQSEQAAWLRKLHVVKDPESVVRAMANGTITIESARTFAEIAPTLHKKMTNELLKKVGMKAQRGVILPYNKRASISVFTGEPVDASYQPKNIAAFQQRYAAKRAQPQAPGDRVPRGKPTDSSRKAAMIDQEEQ